MGKTVLRYFILLFWVFPFPVLVWAGTVEFSEERINSYFPKDFRNILVKNGILEEDLRTALRTPLYIKKSQGRSGSSFLLSLNNRFVFKTVTLSEFEFFCELAKSYFKYLEENPKSRLVPIYGLYQVFHLNFEYLIAMPNLMPEGKAGYKYYDLKGLEPRRGFERTDGVIDDNLFVIPDSPILDHQQVRLLLKDMQFLKKKEIVDYSLFISQRDGAEPTVYIIDFFGQYGVTRKIEHFFKRTFLWEDNQIPVIAPTDYFARMAYLLWKLHNICVEECSTTF